MPRKPKPRPHQYGEGSLYQRKDGRFALQFYVGGKAVTVYGRSEAECRQKRAERLAPRPATVNATAAQTVEQYGIAWLAGHKPHLKTRTHIRYGELLRLHLYPHYGDAPLGELRPEHLRQLYAALVARLAPATVRQLHLVIHKLLGDAVRDGVLAENVSDRVQPPRVPRYEAPTLTTAEARRLLDALASDRLRALYVLALTTGMRSGELRGLRWPDLDLDAGRLRVRGQLEKLTGQPPRVVETKTSRAHPIQLAPVAVAALRQRKREQAAERLAAGAGWQDGEYVFAREDGGPYTAKGLLARHYALLSRHKLPRVTIHGLRHTVATLLHEEGVPVRAVSDLLGHSSTSITMQVYSHLTGGMASQATAALERLFGAAGGEEPPQSDGQTG